MTDPRDGTYNLLYDPKYDWAAEAKKLATPFWEAESTEEENEILSQAFIKHEVANSSLKTSQPRSILSLALEAEKLRYAVT